MTDVLTEITKSIWDAWDAGGYPNGFDELKGQVRAAIAEARRLGWQLAPVEPDAKMRREGARSGVLLTILPLEDAMAQNYRAMLSSAPSIEEG